MPAPIDWTPELEDAFVEGILEGTSIANVCKEIGISPASFYRHRIESETFERTIAHAQEASIEREMDGLIELADTANEETATAVKLKVWTRMWVAGKRKPKRYGDKVEQFISGPDGAPIQAAITVEFVKPK